MAEKGEGVNYDDGIIVLCFFFSIIGASYRRVAPSARQ